ncbi:MAG TPA: PilZ domain-containing protein [Polyangia bacterium]
MKTIVASHNPDLARDFDRDLLRRRDLRLVTARDTDDLLDKLRAGADICFIDRVLPDGDAAAAVGAIRADKRLAHIPLVMVTTSGAPAGDRADAQAIGFADVVELPAPPGALGLLVGRLLGVPLREDDRFAVRVHVFDASGAESPETYIGTSVDLSENGMLLKAKKTAAAGSVLGMRFALPGRAGELSLRGRVVRADDKGFAPQHALALAFENVTAADRAALHEYLRVLTGDRPFSWRTTDDGGRTIVELYGVLRAESDVAALAKLKGDVWLKLREFRRISSDSVQKWIDLVRAMPAGRLHLIECPIPFIHQANLITNLLERQEVESFFAPYSCAACGLDEERLIDVKRDLDGGKRRTPPAHKCSSCGAALAFDELTEQYFAFLDR